MFKLKAALLGGAAALALATGAFSADIPARGPVYTKAPQAWSWEGQYIGVHAGYLWGSNEISNAGAFGELSPTGGLGGFQIGYNHHISRNWIVGYEIDVSFAGADDAGLIGGAITNANSDMIGSCTTMTMTRPTSVHRSRPTDVIIILRTCATALAPCVRRATNSLEWRSL